MKFRNYNPEKDKNAIRDIWQEIGWIISDNYKPLDLFLTNCNAIVHDIHNRAECLVLSAPGEMAYLKKDLDFAAVLAVTVGFAGRKSGVARKMTAQAIAHEALRGADIVGLGIFDQGYYDKLGFGNLPYQQIVQVSPSNIKIKKIHSTPERLTSKDAELIHFSRINRMRWHGRVNLPSFTTKGEMDWDKSTMGLGYFDKNRILTHHIVFRGRGKERGPVEEMWMAYQNLEQFLELLSLIQSLEDQVELVRLHIPQYIQFQDLIEKPFHVQRLTRGGKFKNHIESISYQQSRIVNLKSCIDKTSLPYGKTVSFNLKLHDPIEKYLDSDCEWQGISGDYEITLGPESSLKEGHNPDLPLMDASVNAFTRLWLGVKLPSFLALNGDLKMPTNLLKELDALFAPLPEPCVDWDM